MESHDAAFPVNDGMKRGDIGKPDDWSRTPAESGVVDCGQETKRPVAAAEAPDGVHVVIGKRRIDVVKPIGIAAGKIARLLPVRLWAAIVSRPTRAKAAR